MNITREQALAELNRRGVSIPSSPTPKPNISKEEALQELKRRGVPVDMKTAFRRQGAEMLKDLSSGAESLVYGLNKSLGDFSHGAVQPIAESGLFGENVTNASKEVANQRNEGYRQALQKNPNAALAGNVAGHLGLSAPGVAAGGITKIPGFLKYLMPIIGGAASGAATYVEPHESRTSNAIKGGVLGGTLGAVGPAAKLAVRGIKSSNQFLKHIPEALDTKRLAGNIMRGVQKAEDVSSKGFTSLIHEATKDGIKTELPKMSLRTLREGLPRDHKKSLFRYIEDTSTANAHNAYKDLGKYIRDAGNKKLKSGLTTAEANTLSAAKSAQEKIKREMFRSFKKAGRQDLSKEFTELNKHYIENVLPHRNSVITKFQKGKMTERDFLKSLSKNKEFKAQLGKQYPALEVRGSFPSILKGAGVTGGTAAGVDYLFGKK